MSLILNTNTSSLVAQQRLNHNIKTYQNSLERLSSGLRINSAADDAAGLTISKNMEGQVLRMKQASRNVQDGISILQIAEGALAVIGDNLQRIRELTVQGANDTNTEASREAITNEIHALLSDIDRIAESTQFNNIQLLDGSVGTGAIIHVGPDGDEQTNTVNISSVLRDASSEGLGALGGFFPDLDAVLNDGFTSADDAQAFLSDIDTAIRNVVNQRAGLGSYQNQLESAANNLGSSIENFQASISRIRDLDLADETATMVQYQILQEASASVLAQTNRLPQMILSILQQ